MALYDKASLVLIPSGTKAGTVYSQKPTSGDGDFDFTRSTYATRVNSQGLIEKEKQNLILKSNNFYQSPWSKTDSTVTGGQTGYDGSSDAFLLESSTTGSPRLEQNVTLTGLNTFSVYAKSATDTFIQIRTFGADSEVWINLATGGIVSSSGAGYITSKAENIGSGWYRCSVTVNGSLSNVRVYPASAFGVYSTSGNGIYIQDTQLEQGLVATDVIETTTSAVYTGITDNVPRLDYDGDCPSLLLEPSRTNKLTHSEYINTTTFNFTADLTIDNNQATSPEGLNNAAKLTPNTNTNYHQLRTSAATVNGNDIVSCFVKADGYNYAQIASWATGTDYVNFNLTDGSVSAVGSSGPSVYGIDDYGDGWYRIYANVQASGGGLVGIGVITYATAAWSQSFAGNGTDGILIYGAQVEEGSYATSYIPTYGTSVTRNADTSATNPLQPNVIKSTDNYSIFFDISNDEGGDTADAGNSQWLKGRNSLGANIWSLRKSDFSGLKQHSLYLNIDSDYVFLHQTINKACFVFTSNEVKIFLDGSLNATYTTTNSPLDFDKIALDYGTSDRTNIVMSSLVLFSQALTNEEAIALTTV